MSLKLANKIKLWGALAAIAMAPFMVAGQATAGAATVLAAKQAGASESSSSTLKTPDDGCKGVGCTSEVVNDAGSGKTAKLDLTGIVQTALNWLFWIVGILAVIMIIVGGIMYSISLGDPGKIKKAKDTITYGIVGLVIALLAFAIVNFVIGIFK